MTAVRSAESTPGSNDQQPADQDPADKPAAIRTVGLRKTYESGGKDLTAVDGIDLTVAQGEFFGLLGPNGAGKSTTIGMLTTRIRPSAGQAFVGGIDVVKNASAAKLLLGVVTQTNTLDRSLTVSENLEFHGRFFGLSARESRKRAKVLLEQFQLSDRADAMATELSGGMAQRLMIARAMAHRPRVLFLDEPTSGIDPQSRINLWQILRNLHEEGQTILLTTHYLEEADALCERVAIIDHGRVLVDGSPAELKRSVGTDTVVTVTFDGPATAIASELESLPGVGKVELANAADPHASDTNTADPNTTGADTADSNTVRVHAAEPQGLVRRIVEVSDAHDLQMLDATTHVASLENVFLTLTGREYRE